MQKQVAATLISEMETQTGKKIHTELVPFYAFYKAEANHQNYYLKDPGKSYYRNENFPKMKLLKEHHNVWL